MACWVLAVSLLLLLPLCAVPLRGQQVGYEYIQSAVGGEAAIFLNLWGTLGGCGAGTSNQLYVQFVTGSVLGQSALYPVILNDELRDVVPDNCVNLTGRVLDGNGLGPLYLTPDSGYDFYQLYNTAGTDASTPDNYTLLTASAPDTPSTYVSQLSSLQPPFLVPLTGPSTGPSVGLLYNGGFEQQLVASTIDADRSVAAGWTGNYTLQAYGTISVVAPTLPGQAALAQRRYVSLLPRGVGGCGDVSCSVNSLSQSSIPLTLGLQYSLSWYASCGVVNQTLVPCSYTVSTTGPTFTTAFAQAGRNWQHQLLSVAFTSLTAATSLVTFTAVTGNPLIDTVIFTYTSTDSQLNSTLPRFPDEWTDGFTNGSLFTQDSSVPYSELVINSTLAANVTDYLAVSTNGQVQSGGLVHTYPNYTYVATNSNGSAESTITAQGDRNYTLSLVATAFAVAPDAVIAVSMSFLAVVPSGGTNLAGGYNPGVPPVCTSTTTTSCNEAAIPHTTSTRRRLLQVTPSYDTKTVYYTCSEPGFPCNHSLLTLTLSPPSYLVQYLVYIQLVVYNMDVALTNLQLTSVASSLPILSNTPPPQTGGAIGDPQFTGLRGQRFQVHGVSGTVYNLITDRTLQVNARFDFLASGGGPRADIIATQPWTHPGTYMGAMSFQVRSGANGSHVHVVVVEAGGPEEGFASVSINDQQVSHPYMRQPAGDTEEETEQLTVRFAHSHVLELQTGQFHFRLVNSDRFINHEVAPRVPLHELQCHGLLGQTRLNERHPSALRYIAGRVDDYAVGAEGDGTALLGSGFVYNLFHSEASSSSSQ